MIDLYYWTTPNGHKITIFLEETGISVQHQADEYRQGRSVHAGVFENLAEQSHPGDRRHRSGRWRRAAQHFRVGSDLGISRRQERQVSATRCARTRRRDAMAVLADGRARADARTKSIISAAIPPRKLPMRSSVIRRKPSGFTACSTSAWKTASLSPATIRSRDMACYPWIVLHERQGQDLNDFSHLKRWFERIQQRPAVQRAYELAKTINVDSRGNDAKRGRRFSLVRGEAAESRE